MIIYKVTLFTRNERIPMLRGAKKEGLISQTISVPDRVGTFGQNLKITVYFNSLSIHEEWPDAQQWHLLGHP